MVIFPKIASQEPLEYHWDSFHSVRLFAFSADFKLVERWYKEHLNGWYVENSAETSLIINNGADDAQLESWIIVDAKSENEMEELQAYLQSDQIWDLKETAPSGALGVHFIHKGGSLKS